MRSHLACLTTPSDIVKMAPLCQALAARGQRLVIVLAGAQSQALGALGDFFELSRHAQLVLQDPQGLTPDDPMPLLGRLRPELVLVQGAGPCAQAMALAACRLGIPVAQLAAGEPADESLGASAARDPIADRARWLFPFSAQASRHLRVQGIHSQRMHGLGSTAIDAALWTADRMERAGPTDILPVELLQFLQVHAQQPLLLVSTQGAQHQGAPMQRVAAAIGGLLQLHPQLGVVWTVPAHPRYRAHLHMGLASQSPEILSRLHLTNDLPYPARIGLLVRSHFSLSDCSELQQAASALHKPVLILGRSDQPHPLVQAGAARQVEATARQILEQACEWLADPLLLASMQLPTSPWGDGRAAQRIAEVLCQPGFHPIHASRQPA